MAELNNEVLDQIISLLGSLKEPETQVEYSKMTKDELKAVCRESDCGSCAICDSVNHVCYGCPMDKCMSKVPYDEIPIGEDRKPWPCQTEDEDDDENTVYRLTPKGIACIDLINAGLMESINDPRFNDFWTMFDNDMHRLGYIEEE